MVLLVLQTVSIATGRELLDRLSVIFIIAQLIILLGSFNVIMY